MNVFEKEDLIVECMGYEGAFNALVSVMGQAEVEDFFDFIIRVNELVADEALAD